MTPAVTPGTCIRVVSWDSDPTVIATPTVIWSMMIAFAEALPFEPTFTGRGRAASSAVMPARYWPWAVPLGTCTVKLSNLSEPADSVTAFGRPVTQHPGPEQLRKGRLKVLPPVGAVPPVERLTSSFSVLLAV